MPLIENDVWTLQWEVACVQWLHQNHHVPKPVNFGDTLEVVAVLEVTPVIHWIWNEQRHKTFFLLIILCRSSGWCFDLTCLCFYTDKCTAFSLQLTLAPNYLSFCCLLFEYGVLVSLPFSLLHEITEQNYFSQSSISKSIPVSSLPALLVPARVTELGWAAQSEMLLQLESVHWGTFGGWLAGHCCRLLVGKPGMVNRLISKLLLQCWSVVHRKQALFWLVCFANWYFYNFILLFCTQLLLWD